MLAQLFRLPQWVALATTFNNTSSLPLLLLQSLDRVGSLRLILRGDESTSDAIERGQSYFLVCAVVSKTIAYAVGPRMLHDGGNTDDDPGNNEEQHPAQCEDERLTETTSLLPERAQNAKRAIGVRVCSWTKWLVSFFPSRVREELMAPFGDPFAGVAIGCTLLGALLGLVPALHRAFFFRDENGGYLEAWLTQSVRNIGRLFTTLQIFLVGCKLGVAFERMVARNGTGGDSSRIPRRAITIIFLVRLIAWPAVSISLIYGLAKHTKLLGDDPILWFSMMLMPAGPPALVISGLAEVAQASEMEKMAIAKTLTVRIDQTTNDLPADDTRSCMHYRRLYALVSRARSRPPRRCSRRELDDVYISHHGHESQVDGRPPYRKNLCIIYYSKCKERSIIMLHQIHS